MFSRNMWQVEKHCVVPEQLMDMLLNKEENIGLSFLQSDSWKRKFCAGSRHGAMFWNCDLIPTTTLFPRREARERERQTVWLTRRRGSESQHPLSLTATFTLRLLYMRKTHSEICTHTNTHTYLEKKDIQTTNTGLPIWMLYLWGLLLISFSEHKNPNLSWN